MYEIIRSDRFNQMKKEMDLIHEECFDQFVAGVISWYQHEITHPTVYFDHGPYQIKPPNLFNLFEYPNAYGEAVCNLFVQSEVNYQLDRWEHRTVADAKDIAIDIFNNANAEYRQTMSTDVGVVLDGYHLFYCYQDDICENTYYYNPYVKEVW